MPNVGIGIPFCRELHGFLRNTSDRRAAGGQVGDVAHDALRGSGREEGHGSFSPERVQL